MRYHFIEICLLIFLQRGMIYSSRPDLLHVRKEIWSWRLPVVSSGDRFRYLRRLYQSLLNPRMSKEFRKHHNYESIKLLLELLDDPECFLECCETFTINVICSAVYGIRLEKNNSSIIKELYSVWRLIFKRKSSTIHPRLTYTY